MRQIINPILPGFNPDPSILRVDGDYYIATSTFEWFPGVQIHHSKDMIHWELITRPLDRRSQLDLSGVPDSCGVWAPCISYSDGLFFLIYSVVKSLEGITIDLKNYLVFSENILEGWSEPVFLNSSGFDPSLFHDLDGKRWIVNMLWDHRQDRNSFGGILLQEYMHREKKLAGPVYNIFKGTPIGVTEGPHLYQHNGFYYLMTAEGGTGVRHAVSMARSKSLFGPYEIDPENPILTSFQSNSGLQKAGHASLVETQNGQWYLAHLCSRPLDRGYSTLGRETALQKMRWTEDGWIRLEDGGRNPKLKIQVPGLTEKAVPPAKEDFNGPDLPLDFQSLRVPANEEWMSFRERPGFLRLKGGESLASLFNQALVARRWQHFHFTAETGVEFDPVNFQQMAGLVCYYNTKAYYYLFISHDEASGKVIGMMTADPRRKEKPVKVNIPVEGAKRVCLRVEVNLEKLQFYYSIDGSVWEKIGPVLNAAILSDEYNTFWPKPGWGFTGAFVGICCQDLSGAKRHADFDYFNYRGR